MSSLLFKNVTKIFPSGVEAVKDFNLKIDDKEFIVFVGPSGCGKSTTLRMIAGLEEVTSGEIYIGDVLVNDVQPKNRNISMVFQNYALYPHMSVFDNIGFGLKLRKTGKNEIEEKVRNASRILDIEELLYRKPRALSGGQMQRVALARAIVREPSVFLMDEPLSNLDAKMRVQTRSEIIKLHQRLQTTFIYVTHDQTEAMTMADRIVIIHKGIIQQVDTPEEIYLNPSNVFVANFIGNPPMNIIEGIFTVEDDKYIIKMPSSTLILNQSIANSLQKLGYMNRSIYYGIRPEDITLATSSNQSYIIGTVDLVEILGSEKYIYCSGYGAPVIMKTMSRDYPVISEKIKLAINLDKIKFFDKETGNAINLSMPKSQVAEAL